MDFRHDDIAPAHQSTFQWLFDAKKSIFTEWIQQGQGIFWINGKAGSGKSTLMKYAYHHKDTSRLFCGNTSSSARIMASYFFHARGSSLQKSHVGKKSHHVSFFFSGQLRLDQRPTSPAANICNSARHNLDPECLHKAGFPRSILCQLFKKDESLVPRALPEVWSTNKEFTRKSFWTETKLQQAIKKLSQPTEAGVTICLFLDGLDELEGDLGSLAQFCLEITQCSGARNASIKACIASRPLPPLVQSFQRCIGLRLQDLTHEDIRKYVSDTLQSEDSIRLLVHYEIHHAESLVNDVVFKASGVFLWVKVVCKGLPEGLEEGDTIEELQANLDGLPGELEELLKRILTSIKTEHSQDAAKIFDILKCAREPPRLIQLALALEGGDVALNRSEEATPKQKLKNMMIIKSKRLRSRCAGLIETSFGDVDAEDM